jgi:hypothetical protein
MIIDGTGRAQGMRVNRPDLAPQLHLGVDGIDHPRK